MTPLSHRLATLSTGGKLALAVAVFVAGAVGGSAGVLTTRGLAPARQSVAATAPTEPEQQQRRERTVRYKAPARTKPATTPAESSAAVTRSLPRDSGEESERKPTAQGTRRTRGDERAVAEDDEPVVAEPEPTPAVDEAPADEEAGDSPETQPEPAPAEENEEPPPAEPGSDTESGGTDGDTSGDTGGETGGEEGGEQPPEEDPANSVGAATG